MLHLSLRASALAAFLAGSAFAAACPVEAARPPVFVYQQTFNAWPVRTDLIKQHYFAIPGLSSGTDIAVGKDGNLWVGNQCDGIVRVTPAGVATHFTYPNPSPSQCNDPMSLTLGAGGNVWFADPYWNFIASISPTGKMTMHPMPVATPCNYYPSYPNGIVEGPGGGMWFTLQNAGNPFCAGHPSDTPAVGRLVAGKMTFYYTGAPGTTHTYNPRGYITVGADNALYFPVADPGVGLDIGRITTGSHPALSFTTPVKSSNCYGSGGAYKPFCVANVDGIVKGPDDNLWITEYFDGVIIKYSGGGSGAFSVFPIPGDPGGTSGPLAPRRITNGPDGALWFTTNQAQKLGRVATNGTIRFFVQSHAVTGAGIALLGQELWFTIDGYSPTGDTIGWVEP